MYYNYLLVIVSFTFKNPRELISKLARFPNVCQHIKVIRFLYTSNNQLENIIKYKILLHAIIMQLI